jgi:hypothetical protein
MQLSHLLILRLPCVPSALPRGSSARLSMYAASRVFSGERARRALTRPSSWVLMVRSTRLFTHLTSEAAWVPEREKILSA